MEEITRRLETINVAEADFQLRQDLLGEPSKDEAVRKIRGEIRNDAYIMKKTELTQEELEKLRKIDLGGTATETIESLSSRILGAYRWWLSERKKRQKIFQHIKFPRIDLSD